MLRKLYKHEFYSLLRTLAPTYIALILLAITTRISFAFNDSGWVATVRVLSTLFYGLSVVGIFVLAYILIIRRFYKNLLSKEGYLTFSLPFSATQHINCKLVCGVVVMLLNMVALLLSLTIFTVGTGFWSEFSVAIKSGFAELKQLNSAFVVLIFAEIFAIAIFGIVESLLMFYASIAIGQQFKNRTAGSVITYILIYVGLQIIGAFLSLPTVTLVSVQLSRLETYEAKASAVLAIILFVEIILSAVFYFITRHLLTKKLNLE